MATRVERGGADRPLPDMTTEDLPETLLTELFEGVKSENFTFFRRRDLRGRVAKIAVNDLEGVLRQVSERILSSPEHSDPQASMARLMSLLELESMQGAFPSASDAVATARKMFKQATYYLEHMKEEVLSPTLYGRVRAVIDTILQILEMILLTFGISDFFEEFDYDFQAEMRIHKIMMLMTMIGSMLAGLVALLGLSTGTLVVGVFLVLLFTFDWVYKNYLKPIPATLPNCENWTKQISLGQLGRPFERRTYSNSIAKALITGDKTGTHAILTGNTGVGKTEAAKAFAYAVTRGDYPELKGKSVFYVDTANLLVSLGSEMGSNSIFRKIDRALGRHRDNVIFIFDEFHAAFKDKDRNVLPELLKTKLNKGGLFRHVVALTTDREYAQDIQPNEAIVRRFGEPIVIENMEREDVLAFLSQRLISVTPHVQIQPETLEYLYDKTVAKFPDKAQPHWVEGVLQKCIQQTYGRRLTPLQKDHQTDQQKEAAYVAQGALLFDPAPVEKQEELADLQRRMQARETPLKEEEASLAQLERAYTLLADAKRIVCEMALKVSRISSERFSSKETADVKLFLFYKYVIQPAAARLAQAEATKLDRSAVISQETIDQVLAELAGADEKEE